MLGIVVMNLIIVADLADPYMTDCLEAGWFVQRAGGDSNIFPAAGMPKQRGTAFSTESPMYVRGFIGCGFEPFQPTFVFKLKLIQCNAGISAKIAMETPAL